MKTGKANNYIAHFPLRDTYQLQVHSQQIDTISLGKSKTGDKKGKICVLSFLVSFLPKLDPYLFWHFFSAPSPFDKAVHALSRWRDGSGVGKGGRAKMQSGRKVGGRSWIDQTTDIKGKRERK